MISTTDLLAIVAIILSLTALFQRSRENKLSSRHDLTNTITELTSIRAEWLKLSLDGKARTEEGVSIARVYGIQRRFLIRFGIRLLDEIPKKQVFEVDFNALALACHESGDPKGALELWRRCIEKSKSDPENPILLAMNLRAIARFHFSEGLADEGRRYYQDSLNVPLPEGYDTFPRMRADTYRMWAKEEILAGFDEAGAALVVRAREAAQRIVHRAARRSMIEYIDKLRPESTP